MGITDNMTTEYILPSLGTILAVHLLYRLLRFAHLYFIRQSTLPRYLHAGENSYALVTGASDGIGVELARQLLAKGFNVILHSRNPDKLSRIQQDLSRQYPNRKAVIVAATADDPLNSVPKVETLVKDIESQGGRLTVLINNVGGTLMFGPTYRSFEEIPYGIVDKQISLNVRFPTLLTKALSPVLKANKPSLIINVGSYAGEQCPPWLTIYSPSKAFNNAFSMSLTAEMWAYKTDIEVLGVLVAQVQSAGNFDHPSFAVLTSEECARDILDRVGCGKRLVTASWRHCVAAEGIKWLPQEFVERLFIHFLRQRRAAEEMNSKEQ
jgi:17beta-estradiol 17-dehydrogenase / very-long-chain 3-oxoacyl-CoA reductase